MVITINHRQPPTHLQDKQHQQHHQEIESSEPHQEKNSKPQNDQTLQDLQTNQRKGILVEVADDYLPILNKKIINYYEEKNRQRQQDGTIHIFEITDCLRKSLILQQYPEEIENKLTIWDCMNFDHGLNSETILVNILDSQAKKDNSASHTEYQYNIDFSGISGHPDYIENNVVFELKSINKFKPLILSNDSVTNYIRQIVLYMILMSIENGRIIVKYNLPFFPELVTYDTQILPEFNFIGDGKPLYKLNFHKDTGQFPYFSVKINIPLDADIREQVKKGLLEVVKPLYMKGDITKFPRLEGSLEGKNFKCNNYCKVRNKCHQIPDEQNDNNIREILLNKHIDSQMNKIRRNGKRKDKNI